MLNDVIISKKQTTFHELPNGNVVKDFEEVFPNGKSDGKVIIHYDYDSLSSNLKQVQREDGMYVTYLWGYRNQLPVAKIENATVEQVKAALGGIPNLGAGGLSASQEQTLRTSDKLSNAMVYTFQYDPLIGITSSKGPNGKESTYVYDKLGRLLYTKDFQGNITQQQEYHYKQ